MPVQISRSIRIAVMSLVAGILGNAGSLIAGPITPGSAQRIPEITMNPTQGQTIKPESLIGDAYASQGLNGSMFSSLSAATLIDIGGVTAFAPVTNNSQGYSLNFHSFIGLQIVDPLTGAAASARSITVEFVGLKPTDGYLYAMSPDGGILGATLANDGIGAHGGFLATLNYDNIGSFAIWSLNPGLLQGTDYSPWGIAEITVNTNVAHNPEPATISLGFAGMVGAAGFAWKRRRRT